MGMGDRDRYFLVGLVYLDIVTPLLRTLLEQDYTKKGFESFKGFLDSNPIRHILFHLRKKNIKCCLDSEKCNNNVILPLSVYQWNRLYKSKEITEHKGSDECHCQYEAQNISLTNIDISLAGSILFNCCKLSSIEETSIQSLRRLKNEYFSHNSGSLSEAEFRAVWENLKLYVLQIDSSKKNEFEIILDKPLDETRNNAYQTVLHNMFNNVMEAKAKIEELCPELEFVSDKQGQGTKRKYTVMEASYQANMVEWKSSFRQCNSNKRVKVMMTQRSSTEHFQLLSYLLLRMAPRAVREVFDKEFHPKVLQSVLRSSSSKLRRHISLAQWRLLFTTNTGSVTSDSLDTQIMLVLLRHLAECRIANVLPIHGDVSTGSDLTRINYYRKIIIHSQDQMSDKDFEQACHDIVGAIIRLSKGHLEDECKSLLPDAFHGLDETDVAQSSHLSSKYLEQGLFEASPDFNQHNVLTYIGYQRTELEISSMNFDSKLAIKDKEALEKIKNLDRNIRKALEQVTFKIRDNNITKLKVSNIQLDLDSTMQNTLQDIDTRNVKAKVITNELKKLQIKFELLRQKLGDATDTHILLSIANTVREGEEHFRKLDRDSGKIRFDPIQNKTKTTIEAICKTFIEHVEDHLPKKQVISQEQSIDVNNIQLQKLTSYQIPKGEQEIHIRGCAILNKKEVCFSDRGNNRLIFMTTKGYHKCFSLPCQPGDITILQGNKVAVSLMDMNVVYIINTENMTSETIFLNGHGSVSGLTYYQDFMVMRIKDGYVFVDYKGKYLKQIKIPGKKMPYVACAKERIYFAKWERNEVHCWNFSAQKLWVYKDETIISSPNGVCTDKDGNVFVTGSKSNNVVVISSDGSTCMEILKNQNFPIAIDFDKENKRLLVCSSNSNADLYSLQ